MRSNELWTDGTVVRTKGGIAPLLKALQWVLWAPLVAFGCLRLPDRLDEATSPRWLKFGPSRKASPGREYLDTFFSTQSYYPQMV
ncbi:hypothetical protein IG631_18740 [Alternaria alternata]|nr:hypothetical protein IG631_18740 [Alternaria alternata]